MKALISGQHGFLGTHLTTRLEKWEITAVPRVYLGRLDLLSNLMKEVEPDYIFHLGAYGNMSSQTDEQWIFESNVIGTWNMLQASKDINYKGFINFGSSSEYGRKDHPMKESDTPETDSFYGASKVAGTYLARAVARQFNKPIVTVRPFSVYGPQEADFRFIPKVIHNKLKGEEIQVEEKAMHDWIYVEDFINGVLIVADKAQELKGQVINIGTGQEVSNKDMMGYLSAVAGKIEYKSVKGLRKNDSKHWVADNKVLKSLGWKQQYDLFEGLRETYKFYKEKYV